MSNFVEYTSTKDDVMVSFVPVLRKNLKYKRR